MFPKIQILTIEDLLGGKTVLMPYNYGTFKQAERVKAGADADQPKLFE